MVVIPDDGIILDWCLRGSYGFGPPALPFAIALVLLDGADGPDRKKIALPKIRRSWEQLAIVKQRVTLK